MSDNGEHDGTVPAYSSTWAGSRTGLIPESAIAADSETRLDDSTDSVVREASSIPDEVVAVAAKTEASVDGIAVATTTTLVSEVPAPFSATTSFNVSLVTCP